MTDDIGSGEGQALDAEVSAINNVPVDAVQQAEEAAAAHEATIGLADRSVAGSTLKIEKLKAQLAGAEQELVDALAAREGLN